MSDSGRRAHRAGEPITDVCNGAAEEGGGIDVPFADETDQFRGSGGAD